MSHSEAKFDELGGGSHWENIQETDYVSHCIGFVSFDKTYFFFKTKDISFCLTKSLVLKRSFLSKQKINRIFQYYVLYNSLPASAQIGNSEMLDQMLCYMYRFISFR